LAKTKVRNISPSRLKWLRRPSDREKVKPSYFLLPKERKFPYKNKDGSINCKLLRGALTRAGQYGYKSVQSKAKKLYEKYCKK